jgi:isoquinoline 1-oxidoreductase alpha subunit
MVLLILSRGADVRGFHTGQRRMFKSRAEGGFPVLTLSINGDSQTFDISPDMPLLWLLRDIAGLTGTKFGCGIAQCGACTVHLDGVATRSCVLPVSAIGSRAVTTIEAIGGSAIGKRVQEAWLERVVIQCGYCQSGQIMSATALLQHKPAPTDADIDVAMSGNICRCGTYARIRDAIHLAASNVPLGDTPPAGGNAAGGST